jgi:hypothetical protein
LVSQLKSPAMPKACSDSLVPPVILRQFCAPVSAFRT